MQSPLNDTHRQPVPYSYGLFPFLFVAFLSRDSQGFQERTEEKTAWPHISRVINSRSCWLHVRAEAFAKSVFQKSPPPGLLRGR